MLKTKTKVTLSLTSLACTLICISFIFIFQHVEAITCANATCDTTFEVNVRETLSVSVTTPTNWATGDVNTFLRNTINVNVSTNNSNGFTASMYSQGTTNLTNTTRNTETLPTLTSGSSYTCSSAACSAFPANYWGYSLDDTSYTGTYRPMVSTSSSPITLISAAAGTSTGSQDVYFGAKADANKVAGTYAGTVIISVVTGVIDNNTNPVTPTNPATPGNTENVAQYTPSPTGGANGSTVYTYSRTSGSGSSATSTTTTQVSDGNNVSSYDGYQAPQGVIEDVSSSISEGSSLVSGLATTASVAAATGMFFLFILAKRKEDDEDEEEDELV